MTDMPKTPDGVAFLDNPNAPDVFADDAVGFFVLNGNIRITFTSVRANHVTTPGPIARVVIGRLVMGEKSAESFARGLLDFLESRKQAAETPPPDQRTVN